MANISIIQDNKVDGWELLSVHNPLAFICEVEYDGVTPDFVSVRLESEDVVIFEGKAITFKDSAPKTRQYIFIADMFIRGQMPEYDDEVQASDTLIPIQNITKSFTIIFTHENITASTSFVACNAASQFGDEFGACLKDINLPKTYTAGENGVVYLYMYNWDENNVISMDTNLVTAYITDSNGNPFTDSNGDKFLTVI
jgi:hypothetical protein